MTVKSFVNIVLPLVTFKPFCKFVTPVAVISAKVTLSVELNAMLVLTPAAVFAPVPPDAIAKGVDSDKIDVASVPVFASNVKFESDPKGPLLL